MEAILETKAETILQFLHGLRGSLYVTFEEGTCAAWLRDLLKPHVAQVLVCDAYIAQLDAAKVFPGRIVTEVTPLKGFYCAEDSLGVVYTVDDSADQTATAINPFMADTTSLREQVVSIEEARRALQDITRDRAVLHRSASFFVAPASCRRFCVGRANVNPAGWKGRALEAPILLKEEYSAGNGNGPYMKSRFEQLGELLGKHRAAEVVPLGLLALVGLKKLQLFQLFHALGDHPQL
jgi:hypothetical protein